MEVGRVAHDDISKVRVRRDLTPSRDPYTKSLGKGRHLLYRVNPGGLRSWGARFTPMIEVDGRKRAGKKQFTSFDTLGPDDYSAAVEAATRWFALITQGIDLGSGYTVGRAGKDHVAALVAADRATDAAAAVGRSFERYLYPDPLARADLATLTKAQLEAWRERVAQGTGKAGKVKPLTAASVNREFNNLKAALNRAWRNSKCESNRAWAVLERLTEKRPRRPTILALEQCERLLAHAGDGPIGRLILAKLETGARPCELKRANVEDFDAKTSTLRLLHYKGRKSQPRVREAPLTPAAVQLLKRLTRGRAGDEPLLTDHEGKRWTKDSDYRLSRAAIAAAGLPKGTRLYALRHGWITRAIATAGIDPLTVALAAGTSLPMIGLTYGHLLAVETVERLKKAKFGGK
jgi:integrase